MFTKLLALVLALSLSLPLSPARAEGTTVDQVLSKATQVVAGWTHTCALTQDAKVKCWGWNERGLLGDGTYSDSTVPVDVIGLSGVVSLAVGYYHTCAITAEGAAKCWGRNDYGQLGMGSNDLDSNHPVNVIGLDSGVTSIAMDGVSTCAVVHGGVKCWGMDFNYDSIYAPVSVIAPNSNVVSVSISSIHACALLRQGGIKCWGNNISGQLGNGTNDDSLYTPVDVVGFANYRVYLPLVTN